MAKQRTVDEIQKEYNQKLFQLGNLQRQLDKIPRQIDDIGRILNNLDKEADAAYLLETKEAQNKTSKTLDSQKKKEANGKAKEEPIAPVPLPAVQ
jgi:hypothetical protein